MANGKFVAYHRVSTAKQGASGLGLDAQKRAVADFLNGGNWRIVAELTEVESGKNNDRPELAKALDLCRLHGATLIIAKLDRLSRDAHFLLGLEKEGVDFIAADMPTANRLTVGIMAMVADEERRMISARTTAALASAKARGTVLGGFRGVVPTEADRSAAAAARKIKADAQAKLVMRAIEALRAKGAVSLREIAAGLNGDWELAAPRGGMWTATQVSRILARAGQK